MPAVQLPIDPQALSQRRWHQRLTGGQSKQDCFVRAHNLVTSGEFSREAIVELERQYGGDLAADYYANWNALLEEVVYHMARDGHFDPDEKEFIREYVSAFRIPKETARRAYRRAVARAFAEIAAGMIRDGVLDEDESQTLEKLARKFGLSGEDRDRAWQEVASARVQEAFEEILDDGLVSDEEYEDFTTLCQNLGVDLPDSPGFEEQLGFARERWRIMYGDIEGHGLSDVRLRGDEVAHFRGEADWYEPRALYTSGSFASVSGSTRIAKGLSFKQSDLAPSPPTQRRLRLVHTGELVLTNQRLLFISANKDNNSIDWDSVLYINVNSLNEFEVEREKGLSPILHVTQSQLGHSLMAPFIAGRLHAEGLE